MSEQDFRAIEPHCAMRVLAISGRAGGGRDDRPATDAVTLELGAMVSLARAVYAAGGEIVTTADLHLSPVLAAVAVDYVPQHAAEGGRSPFVLLTVVETARPDPAMRHALAPYIEHGALRLLDPEGAEVAAPPLWGEEDMSVEAVGPDVSVRHPITHAFLDRERLDGAVFVSTTSNDEPEMRMTEDRGIQVSVVGETISDRGVAERWAGHDPGRQVLTDRRPELRWDLEPDDVPSGRPAVTPYPLVMQRLVARWRRD